MKKNTKKSTKTTKKVEQPAKKTPIKDSVFKRDKNSVIRPGCLYTEDEVRGFLCLSKKTSPCPSKFTGIHVNGGLVMGRDIIAHLERVSKTTGRGRRANVKIGRRYKSGSVTVVAR